MSPRRDPFFDPTDDGDLRPDPEVIELLREEGPPAVGEHFSHIYKGRRIDWLGDKGRMVKARWDQVHPVGGNIFYPGKLPAFVAYSKERLNDGARSRWNPPIGWASSPIGPEDVAESQQSIAHGIDDLYSSYGMTRAFTTGDEDLDEYLRDRRELKKRLAKCEADDCEIDHERDELRERIEEMEERLKEAVANNEGDLGTVPIQLRDGNHRAYSAYLLNEPWIWVYIPEGHEGGLTKEDFE